MAGHGHEPAAHSHTGDIGEDYNIGTIITVGVVGVLLLFLTIVWLRAMYARADRWEWENKVVNVPFAELHQVRDAQDAKLNSWEWSDPGKGRVTEPVNVAEAQVLRQLQAEQLAQLAAAHASPAVAVASPATPVAAGEQPAPVSAAHELVTPAGGQTPGQQESTGH